MATDAFYAWTPILVGVGEEVKTIAAGTKVTPKDLGTDDEGFQEYLSSGAVRPYEYPEMGKTANAQSPIEFMRSKALGGAEAEEERLMALNDPELRRATRGPLEDEPVPLADGVEEDTGPKK
jgi:hypothetical protein